MATTTAQQLIAYRAELIAGGMPHDIVNDLVKNAAQCIHVHPGLSVATPEDQNTD